MFVDPENVTMPRVKIDSLDSEATISTNHLKLRNKNEKDDIKMLN